MNKVICNVCGTSYPENAAQCPICGFAQNERIGVSEQDRTGSTYTYVKGGRFSKANVKKRNAANISSNADLVEAPAVADREQKNRKPGMIIVAIILLIAIILAGGYIALRFLIPNDFIYEGLGNVIVPEISQNIPTTEPSTEPYAETETTQSAQDNKVCTSVILSVAEITLTSSEETYKLIVTLDPEDTAHQLQFASSDPAVADINSDGIITAKAEGTAVITVTCGEASAECGVICLFETEPTESTTDANAPANTFALNRKEITFDMEGQSWVLYNGGSVSVSDIIWSSDNDAVATIANGKVVAIANGDTTVYGTYDGQVASCVIHCNFDNNGGESSSSGVSEAGGDSSRIYKLHNPYGLADDVTIHVDEQFPLMLVDESGNKITDAQWSVGNTDYCSYENETAKGLAIGTTEITATYEGSTYTCVVRVIE